MKLRVLITLLCSLLTGSVAYCDTYYSRATGNFTTGAIWHTNANTGTPLVTYPGASHNYIIQSGHNVTLSAATTAVSVTINAGGTLTLSGNRTLTSPLTVNGTLALSTTQFTLAGTLNNSGSITGTTAYLTTTTYAVTNSGTISLTTGRIARTTGALTNNGTITLGAGQFTATSGAFTNSATGTLTVTGTATVTLGTGNFVNDNSNTSVNFGSSAVALAGTTRNVGGFVTTGAVSATNTSGTITVNGDINGGSFTKSGNGTINMGTNRTHTFTGIFALGTGSNNTVNGGTNTTINVNVTSATAWTGTGPVFAPNTSTVNFGGAAQTLTTTGISTFYNLTYSNSGVKTRTADTRVTNIFTLAGTATASAPPTYNGTAYGLVYNTTNNRNAGTEWPASFTGSKGVEILSSEITVPNGNDKAFPLDVPLTIASGAKLITGSNGFSFSGDFINSGTWEPSSGGVTITGTRTAQSIGRVNTTGTVSMTKSSGTATFTDNINGGAFTLNGAGTLDLGASFTHVFTGAWTNTNGTLLGNTSTLRIGGATSGTGVSFTANTGTVEFNGAGAQTIPALNYYNLNGTGGNRTLANSGTVGIAGTFTPGAGSYTITGSTVSFNGSGTQTIPAFNYNNLNGTGGNRTLANSGTVGIAGTFTPGAGSYTITGSTVSFNGSGAQTIPAFNYNNLNGTGGNRTLANSGTVGIAGTFTPGAGSYTITGSTVSFNGSGAQTIPAFNYNNLNGTGGNRTLANSGTVGIAGTFTPGAGTYTITGSTVNFNGTSAQTIPAFDFNDLTISGNKGGGNVTLANGGTIGIAGTLADNATNKTFITTNNTINFNGGNQTIPAFSFNDVIISGSGTKTIGAAVGVRTVDIQTGPTLDINNSGMLTVNTP